MYVPSFVRRITAGVVVIGTTTLVVDARAADEAAFVADRVVVRYVAPETGGTARPGFITQRELAFFARIEAQNENVALAAAEYPERYVRAATDRLVARAMLASLMIQRGTEPPNLPKQALEARAELEDRVGGPQALADLLKREQLDEDELMTYLRDFVRAGFYVDKAITPILAVNEDSLREAYRAANHPFRSLKFDDARPRLKRWLATERQRAAELEFLQSARTRIKVTPVGGGPPNPPPVFSSEGGSREKGTQRAP